ncbi:hypothetical protein U8C32_26935 (plasmid) [Sinorhizobium medicae]|uniref:hypothetical protein n=2 Tax=Rhizobiaceae TaxID=82115 RepID=UPI002AF6CD19|nr:hypothetical protein [Sinorhizobium medicae]WQO48478.1 hypothetical protein U8C42_27220 [Sinorhizobium medicae]WQO68865.1 hypothetical protein U8C40_28480 [Sinorhizobium medicae]WQO75923.1 hypothetical protein U8C31_28010 [Sinorhizobium medicae]WQO95086.1 hypothetical protein U8C32_26935 [Sinorhizobium medicae]
MQVSPYRRGKSLMSIYTDERPDLSRELPNWMLEICVKFSHLRLKHGLGRDITGRTPQSLYGIV